MTEMFKFPTTDVTASFQASVKATEKAIAFGQGNLEALVTAGRVWAAGSQELSTGLVGRAQAQVEETVATFKAFAGVTSLKALLDLQAELVRSSISKATAETTRLADESRKLAAETLAPLTARVNVAAETFSRAA